MSTPLCEFGHEVLATDDQDWAVNTNRESELKLRWERNIMIHERLQSGRSVAFRSGGNSLAQRIKSGGVCEYLPVRKDDDVRVGDIVVCQEQATGRYCSRAVMSKEYDHELGDWYFKNGNSSDWPCGLCWSDHLYGKLTTQARARAPPEMID